MNTEDIDGFQQRLQTYRRTLAHYLQQCAMLGNTNVPPSIVHGIEDARDQIRHIKTTLRTWGIQVLDHPDDEGRMDFTSPSSERPDKVQTNLVTIDSLLAGKSVGQKLALAVLVGTIGALLGAIGSYAFAIGRVLNTKVAPVGWASTALLNGAQFGAMAMVIVILLYVILRWITK